MQALSLNVNSSSKIEKLILEDEFDDEEFLEFAIENYSEMFGYIATGKVSIRIHRDIEGPPKRSSGKPAKQPVAYPDESVRQPDVHQAVS